MAEYTAEFEQVREGREKAQDVPSWRDQVAARVMAALLTEECYYESHEDFVVQQAYKFTDALIAEGKRGAGE